MSSETSQVGVESTQGAGVCPHCGVFLQPVPGGGLAIVMTDAHAGPPAVWHAKRPDFPPPPGCRRIWVPFRGWLDVDDDVRRAVDRFFNVPMLTLALLVLPLLVVDYYVSRHDEGHDWLSTGVVIAHVTISAAFLTEFVVKVGIAQSRLGYMARNWLDLIIIILPFLRTLQVFRTVRLLKPLQAARVIQYSRLYAVRGVGIKAVRTMVPVLLGLRFTQRFRNSKPAVAHRPDYSLWPRAALVLEVERLQKKLEELEKRPAPPENIPSTGAKAADSSYHGPEPRARSTPAAEAADPAAPSTCPPGHSTL